MKKIMKCQVCGKYTLSQMHCNKKTVSPHPVTSGVEKHIKERIKMRLKNLEEEEIKKINEQTFPY
jgi:rRNA maturation protein Nop10